MEDEIVYPQDGDFAFYADDQSYVRQGGAGSYHNDQLWERFCRSVLHSQRFFNTDAKALIAQLFENVDAQRNNQKQSPIYEIRPGDEQSTFYRARVVAGRDQIKKFISDPAGQLGVPPERLRRANRMNPAGIACFYGAFEIDTCIAEIRPTVGGLVAAGRFELTRPVFVLDMTKFEAPIRPMSMFEKAYFEKIEQWAFMQSFMEQIAKPVLPSDEYLDYIPTQAVAEYLQHHHKIKQERQPSKIEGVIFQSAQLPPSMNIVLFGGAGQLPEKMQRPPELSALQIEAFEALANFGNQQTNPGIRYADGSLAFHEITSAQFASVQTTFGSKEGAEEPF
ncbi:RES family NAD+ phosphorylase [Mesorhizobium sp.]|uniref:RES family NAD+ phosphorylase n=1 Tax=Mesorhizobium sp. TaxID=1871066 RepID=UPI00257BE0E0|nr:RES family NAD+ phosphorylase [Mesorhizobium sp.]